jgi:hypothetical protein
MGVNFSLFVHTLLVLLMTTWQGAFILTGKL